MTTLAGQMSELDAVNELLWSIGELPVSTISGVPDAETASGILARVSREIQLYGWHCNTLRNYVLSQNVDTQFAVPVNTLKVDTVNPKGNRISGSPTPAQHVNVVMRKSIDGTKRLLWDADKNSETWADGPDELLVNIVQYLDFADLAPHLQLYITAEAGHRFQKGAMGSAALFEFTTEYVREMRELAEQIDSENEDVNMLRDNLQVYRTVYRNHPFWGR